ncbi:MAG: tRNA-intron lyase, partial [Methanobacteriota archaeon]
MDQQKAGIDVKKKVATGVLSKDSVVVVDPREAAKIHSRGHVGTPLSGGRLKLSLVEGLYLLEKGDLQIKNPGSDKTLDFDSMIAYSTKHEENILQTYQAYRDLRERGYTPKTGLKYGAHFRVYPKGKGPGEEHAQYLVHVLPENQQLTPRDLVRLVRLA